MSHGESIQTPNETNGKSLGRTDFLSGGGEMG